MESSTSAESFLSEPLVVGPTSLEGSIWKMHLDRLACWARDWWTDTTHPRFRTSGTNYFLYFAVPLLWVFCLCGDSQLGGTSLLLIVEATAAAASMASLRCMTMKSIVVDAVQVGSLLCISLTFRILDANGIPMYNDSLGICDIVSFRFCFFMLFGVMAGIHASFAIFGWLCNMILCVGVSLPMLVAQVCIFPFACWFFVSHQTRKWQVYMDGATNRALLEHGSDGSFVVCLDSGTILSVNEAMGSKLNRMVHQGLAVLDLIESTDHRKVQDLMSRAPEHVFSSILVTMCSQSIGTVVDCKITSYAISGRKVSCRMIAVGELRPMDEAQGKQPPVAPMSATSSAGARVPARSMNETWGIPVDIPLPDPSSASAKIIEQSLARHRFIDIAGDCHSQMSCCTASSLSFDSVLQRTLHDAWNVQCMATIMTDRDVLDVVNEARQTWNFIHAQGTYQTRRAAARSCIQRVHRFAAEALADELHALEFKEDVRYRRQRLDDDMEALEAADTFANDWVIMREHASQDLWHAHMVFRLSGALPNTQFRKPLGIVCAMLGGRQVRPCVGTFRRLQGALTRAAITMHVGAEVSLQLGAAF